MKPKVQRLIYTILADDKSVAALEATGPEARELLKERWFLKELAVLKIDGEPRQEYDKACKTAYDADDVLFVSSRFRSHSYEWPPLG